MSPLAMELVRRMSVFALILAAVLFALPRVLNELGLWGPSVVDEISAADRAIEAARIYGGDVEDTAFRAARIEADEARRRAEKGEEWRARQAARRALKHAIEAQRVAVSTREASRRQTALIAIDIDSRLSDLEDLYTQVTPGVDKKTGDALISMMKDARKQGAGVILAIEEGALARAKSQAPSATQTLEAARLRLESMRGAAARPQADTRSRSAVPPNSP